MAKHLRGKNIKSAIEEVEHHFHNRERWFGISGDQSGNDWGADTLNPFRAISGAGVYGADADDEAKVLGTSDTPAIAGMIKFDAHRVFIIDVSHDINFKLRLVYGTGTMADAVTAGQYSEWMLLFDSANPQTAAGGPIEVMMPRLRVATNKVWVQCKSGTDNAWVDFFVGIHEYDE